MKYRSLADDPVLKHELRARMRGPLSIWILLGYLGITGGWGVVAAVIGMQHPNGSGSLGPQILSTLTAVQAILIALIAPALTSGAISLERQRQAYETLAASKISARRLIVSKLGASLLFPMLCIGASVPIGMVAAGFGGLTPGSVITAYFQLAIEASILGGIGLFWSAALRSTVASTILSYLSVALALAVTAPFGLPGLLDSDSIQNLGLSGLSSLCPFAVGTGAAQPIPFFNTNVPFWLPGLLIGPVIVALLCTLAESRLELFLRPRRSWSLSLATVLIALLVLFVTGGLAGPSLSSHALIRVDLWLIPLVLLAAALPFCVAPNPAYGKPRGRCHGR